MPGSGSSRARAARAGRSAQPPGRPRGSGSGGPRGRAEREARILDAAGALLVRWGYRKTTIDDVAREAGIGKGTIYLHWKDKGELFRAAVWRASRSAVADTIRRMEADPESGHFHSMWTHGLMAIYENPLLSRLMTDRTDILQGLIDNLDPGIVLSMVSTSETQIRKFQDAGLIRTDVPLNVIIFVIGALKQGLASTAELLGPARSPSAAELTKAISDMMREWLQPKGAQGDVEAGKRIIAEWMQTMNEVLKDVQ